MENELIPIYEALTTAEAEELADRLDDAGIEAYVDYTDSPLEGLVAARSAKIVLVPRQEMAAAREVVARWEAQGHEGVPADESQREETGLELPTEPIPSTDSPSVDIEGQGVERLDADRPGPESPEIEAMRIEDPGPQHGRDVEDPRIKSFGADRPLAQGPDVERPEVEDKPIEELDIRDVIEPETGRASANLRKPPGRKRRRGRKA